MTNSIETYDELWAKRPSRKDGRILLTETVAGHCIHSLNAGESILGYAGPMAAAAADLRAYDYERVCRITKLADLFHDVGKSNNHFQDFLRSGTKNAPIQAIRHEWISMWIVSKWKPWVMSYLLEPVDFDLLLYCITNHHRKRFDLTKATSNGMKMSVLLGHPSIRKIIEAAETLMGHKAPEDVLSSLCDTEIGLLISDQQITTEINRQINQSKLFWRNTTRNMKKDKASRLQRILFISKCLVISSDVAASWLLDGASHLEKFIDDSLPVRPEPDDIKSVIVSAINNSATSTGNCTAENFGEYIHDFQRKAAEDPARVVLVSGGCGSGKTLIAYLRWLKKYQNRRLWITNTTTSATTQEFLDYHGIPDDVRTRLLHSRCVADLQDISEFKHEREPSPVDTEEETGEKNEDLRKTPEFHERESLESWGAPVIVSTVDYPLGVVQNQKSGVYSFPVISISFMTFDEIHSFDDIMWTNLLRFIEENPGLPILLLTATLQKKRVNDLKRVLRKTKETLSVINGPEDFENRSRYRLVRPGQKTTLDYIDEHLANEKKVCIVRNTVPRCMETYDELRDRNPICINSRMVYMDRAKAQENAIRAFRSHGAVLLIGTQVLQQSIDFSADLMIIDLVLIEYIIQRLGRLARYLLDGDPPGMFIVETPPNMQPYSNERGQVFRASKRWLEKLPDRPLSQRDLLDLWRSMRLPKQNIPLGPETLYDNGPIPDVGAVRNIQGVRSVDLMLESYYSRYHDFLRRPKGDQQRMDIKHVILPMNFPPHGHPLCGSIFDLERFRGVRMISDKYIDYDPKRGAKWIETP